MNDLCHRVSIWGMTFEFNGIEERLVAAALEEFWGAIGEVGSENPIHCFSAVDAEIDFSIYLSGSIRARHRGGSSGDKRLLNGEIFRAEFQSRDVHVVREGEDFGIYDMGGALVFSTPQTTAIVGQSRDPMVLPDLIEALILERSRRSLWFQVHGSCWLQDGDVNVMIGESGAGKTTKMLAASASPQFRLLGNDRVFFRMNGTTLEARGYPLPMNIGCGTIRGLGLKLPHFGGADKDKIRLSARDVTDLLAYDYFTWMPVTNVQVKNRATLLENIYLEPDPCHPPWNSAWRSSPNAGEYDKVIDATLNLVKASQ